MKNTMPGSKQKRKPPVKKIDNLDRRIKLDKEEALHLKLDHGLTYQEIAEMSGTTKQAVHQAIAPLIGNMKEVEEFKGKRADIFANKQKELLLALDDAKVKNMAGRDLVVAAGILFDKERLERGQSTVNLASIYSRALEDRTETPQDVALEPDRETGTGGNDADSGG